MKRILLFVTIILICATAGILAQQRPILGTPDPTRLGLDAAQQFLQEVSVDRFEREGFWRTRMSSDTGFVTSRLFVGGPMGKTPIPGEEGLNIPDMHVLGVRVDFLRRGHTSIYIEPIRPIPIEGITKTVSVWVVGRNVDHELVLLIEDFFGRPFELFMGRLNFQGWQRLTVAIPPQAEDGWNGIVQRNPRFSDHMGIRIRGFRIDANPWEAFGSYYVYFDDLRAVTDLFAEFNRDEDDMVDGW